MLNTSVNKKILKLLWKKLWVHSSPPPVNTHTCPCQTARRRPLRELLISSSSVASSFRLHFLPESSGEAGPVGPSREGFLAGDKWQSRACVVRLQGEHACWEPWGVRGRVRGHGWGRWSENTSSAPHCGPVEVLSGSRGSRCWSADRRVRAAAAKACACRGHLKDSELQCSVFWAFFCLFEASDINNRNIMSTIETTFPEPSKNKGLKVTILRECYWKQNKFHPWRLCTP